MRVSQAYFNVLAATDALNSVQGNSKAIGEQLASAKRNFEVGNATITDTREAEARADLARSNQIAAENDLLVAKVTLDQLVGRIGVTPHPLILPAVLPPVVPSQASDWVALAESDSQALKQAQLGAAGRGTRHPTRTRRPPAHAGRQRHATAAAARTSPSTATSRSPATAATPASP